MIHQYFSKLLSLCISLTFLLMSDCHRDCTTPCLPDPPGTCMHSDADLEACPFFPSSPPHESSESFIFSAGDPTVAVFRLLNSNGIPNHTIGSFGGTYAPCHRPTTLLMQDYHWRIPMDPGITESGDKRFVYFDVPEIFGYAVTGIPLDPEANEWYCHPDYGWQKSALDHPDMAHDVDCNNGHIQPTGAYHYHGLPRGLYAYLGGKWPVPKVVLRPEDNDQPIIRLGWGTDGVPVYGPLCLFEGPPGTLKNWWRPQSGYEISPFHKTGSCVPDDAYLGYYEQDYIYVAGDGKLDPCNGHFAPTPEAPDGEYHYHITETFPHIPRCHTEMK